VIDPDGRQLHISCGAALPLARIALRCLGRDGQVTLIDDPTGDGPLARLSTVPAVAGTAPSFEEWALLGAAAERRTTRGPFTSRPLPDSVRTDLAAAAQAEGAHLSFIDKAGDREATARVLVLADRALRAQPAYRREIDAWSRRGGAQATDGVPASAGGARPIERGPTDFRQRDFGSSSALWQPEDPAIAVLFTDADDPPGWLRAGMALCRLLLVATCAGASASLLNQPLDLPGSREMLTKVTHLPGAPLALLQLGYSTGQAPATGRRPIRDILDFPAVNDQESCLADYFVPGAAGSA
jgi:hypothetical protein